MINLDESQIYTLIIDDIRERDMMLVGQGYDYRISPPVIHTDENNTALPSLLHWEESDLKPSSGSYMFHCDQIVIDTTHMETTTTLCDKNFLTLDAFNLQEHSNMQESSQFAQTSVIVKNFGSSSIEQRKVQESSGSCDGVDIAALVDMCFRDEN